MEYGFQVFLIKFYIQRRPAHSLRMIFSSLVVIFSSLKINFSSLSSPTKKSNSTKAGPFVELEFFVEYSTSFSEITKCNEEKKTYSTKAGPSLNMIFLFSFQGLGFRV